MIDFENNSDFIVLLLLGLFLTLYSVLVCRERHCKVLLYQYYEKEIYFSHIVWNISMN